MMTYATDYTQSDLDALVARELAEGEFTQADSLRTAAMYCPLTMTPKQWVAACVANGVRENTARNRLSEIRRQQAEDLALGIQP